MFTRATSFNSNIGSWDISNVTDMSYLFNGVTLSTVNYEALLIGWAEQNPPSGLRFDGGNSTYRTEAGTHKETILISELGWVITDGGLVGNTIPTGAAATITIPEDSSYRFSVADFPLTDIDGDVTSSLKITSLNINGGALTNNGASVAVNQTVSDISKLTFTPVANGNGDNHASFGFQVFDSYDYSVDSYGMTINVTPVNDAPTISADDLTTPEDTPLFCSKSHFTITDIDNESDDLTLTILEGDNFTFTDNFITPAVDYFGNLAVKAEISDGELMDTTTFTVSVTPVDDITTSVRDSLKSTPVRHTLIDTSLVGEVLGQEDTSVTTTVLDSITDSTWQITDTFTEGVLTSSAPAVKFAVVREVIISTEEILLSYLVPVAIEQIPTARNSENETILFAPNPVPSNENEIRFVTPSSLKGEWSIAIYDNSNNLIDSQQFSSDGGYTYRWDLRNSNGVKVGSGTYVAFITVETADGSRKLFKQMIGVQR